MKVAQIKDLAQLADGTTIGEMRVGVKKVFPPRTGKGKFGDWRVQNAMLEDGTGEVRAAFWIKDPIDDLQGQTIVIKSQAGKKGLAGLAVQYSNHTSSNELKVTDQAAIVDSVGEKLAEVGPSAQAARIPSRPSIHHASINSPSDAKKFIFQGAQLMVEAIKASHWVGEQVKLTPEQLQSVASSLFISADRAGLARVFPTGEKVEEVKLETTEDEDDDIGF
jgi:hypothetical protein